MGASSGIRVGLFKSPVRVVAGFLLRSRDTQTGRARRKSRQVLDGQRLLRQQRRVIASLERELDGLKLQVARLAAENRRLREQPPVLPHDPPLPRHGFGPKLMSVCVNLARRVGLRSSVACLQIVCDWLGATVRLPAWTAVRTWLMRVGVAALEEPVEQADDWVWMADHSNQIGPEKVLVIVGLRASRMPPPGVALAQRDVRVLAVEPGVSWKRTDVAGVYRELADRIGAPQAVVVDGAVELREGAEVLQTQRKDVLILSDFKHYAANVLKKLVGDSPRFSRFTAQVGRARSAIQQTELGHLTPPSPRLKARFMNLAATLKWARMVLWQLAHPQSRSRRDISAARLNEKLGWLRAYREDVARWHACQSVVSASITFVNEQGLSADAADRLAAVLQSLRTCAASCAIADRLVAFVRSSAAPLSAGQRLPLSTEILESAFGLFKQLEGQHSKGGFTSLLAAFGALLKPASPASIRRDLARVSVKQMRTWVADHLKTTLASRRKVAYAESATAA